MGTTTKRLAYLASMLQMEMKEHGLLHPDHKIAVDKCHLGYRLEVNDERFCVPARGLLTQRLTKPGLEAVLETLLTVLERKDYVEQAEYGKAYL